MNFTRKAEDALACIFSLKGTTLSDEERAFFKKANPLGFILFGRNIENPQQLRALTDDLKDTLDRNCPILIDQEGGRVQRLKPPTWEQFPPMQTYGDMFCENPASAKQKLKTDTYDIAEALVECGINANCAPVLDVRCKGAHDIIGDRAFSEKPDIVAQLGHNVCDYYLEKGIAPIMKHIPGHGRALCDSHEELPRVEAPLAELEETDFKPFAEMAKSDIGQKVWAMTAHIIYTDIDPDRPASLSPTVIQDIIRDNMEFDGIIISDDLDMKALDGYGTIAERCQGVLNAGCDLALYCWADLQVMMDIAEICPKLSPQTYKRLKNAA